MIATPRSGAPMRPHDDELNVLFARLPDPADRPLPTDEEMDATEWIDPYLDAAIRDDTQGPRPIDVGIAEPGDARTWGACFTIGASARPMTTSDADPRGAPAFVELFLRLPATAFRYWNGVVLEPFEPPFDDAADALGELGRLTHTLGVCYRPPQIIATPDLSPLVGGLPFAGVLLRNASHGVVRVPHLTLPGGGVVRFLSATFLHPPEVRALVGADRARAQAALAAAGVDELFAANRAPVAGVSAGSNGARAHQDVRASNESGSDPPFPTVPM
jgi:hypothetical protein